MDSKFSNFENRVFKAFQYRTLTRLRVGNGVDVHPLVKGKQLILGGEHIKHDYGCDGHSDGDVLTHSIIDAILGSLNKGDLGDHFPSSDEQLKGANSLDLLKIVYEKHIQSQWDIINIDSTIILQTPILKPYIKSMKNQICSILSINNAQLSIKATTTDYLGFIGKEEGIIALAICMLCQEND